MACRRARTPCASPLYVEGVACPRCHDSRSDDQKARYAERQRQAARALELGIDHVGASLPPKPPREA